MTIDAAGVLYVTGNVSGQVLRVDPRTGRSCVIAAGLGRPTAVKHGRGRGAFGAGRLYVSGFDGAVRELTPPRGVRLRATRWHR